jgi:PAT family acetyl-CoA transporter-like MFS transporter 1
LTLLRTEHIEYASTCQTLGMNIGYFTSFTVFLALNNAEFCNAHLRAYGACIGPGGGASGAAGAQRVEKHGQEAS